MAFQWRSTASGVPVTEHGLGLDAVGPKDIGSLVTLEDEKDAKLDKRWMTGGKPSLRGVCDL